MKKSNLGESASKPIEYYGKFCVYCGSTQIIFKDKTRTKNGRLIRRRRYQCKSCHRKFRWGAFVGNKCSTRIIVNVLSDLADGLWFSTTAERAGISKSIVGKMLTKFVPYLNTCQEWASPKLGQTLQLDDMWSTLADDCSFIDVPHQGIIDALVANNQAAVTNVIDVSTNFWAASVAGLDNAVTVASALVKTLRFYKEKPKDAITLVTDGHPLYGMILSLFPAFKHVFQSKEENMAIVNFAEQINKTSREIIPHHIRRFRTVDMMQKTLDVRNFKHNFIRAKKRPNRRTPAEAAHCKLLWGKNKWLTAINIGYVETLKRRLDAYKSRDSKQDILHTNAKALCRSLDSNLEKYLDMKTL